MAEHKDREQFINLRKCELIAMLCADDLPVVERDLFRQFCRMVTALCHFEYLDRLEKLKEFYAPFDPDAGSEVLQAPDPDECHRQVEDVFVEFVRLMERANFKRLSHEEIVEAMNSGASAWGINMDVDFNVFEHLEVFARGDTTGKRWRRRWRKWWWRLEECEVPLYQRLVLILKLRPHKRLDSDIDTRHIYLKLFKDIPKVDLEMLLPGARVQMPGLQRLKLGSSMLGSVAFVIWKVALQIETLASAILHRNLMVFWAPLSLVLGYGYKQYAGFQSTKQSYSLKLTQSLYYLNLDNNAGVITHLLDAAEEQECRETILAYYFLWRRAGEEGWTSAKLDDAIEHYLEEKTDLKVDFEIDDALAKLERWKLLEKSDDCYRVPSLDLALERMDYIWDNYFKYNEPQRA